MGEEELIPTPCIKNTAPAFHLLFLHQPCCIDAYLYTGTGSFPPLVFLPKLKSAASLWGQPQWGNLVAFFFSYKWYFSSWVTPFQGFRWLRIPSSHPPVSQHFVPLLIIIASAFTKGRASCLVTMDTTQAKARPSGKGKEEFVCAGCK